MKQETYDFLAVVKIPVPFPGFDMLGESIDYTAEKMARNIYPSLGEIEEIMGEKFHMKATAVDRHMRRALMHAEYRSGVYPNKELVEFGKIYVCNEFTPKKFIYAAARRANHGK